MSFAPPWVTFTLRQYALLTETAVYDKLPRVKTNYADSGQGNGRFPAIDKVMVSFFWPLVIELGDFKISSATPLNELVWFIAGLLLLTGSSTAVLWWHRRARPDPFI